MIHPLQRRIAILIVVTLLAAIVLRRAYIFAANRAMKGAESSAYKPVAGPFETDGAADIVLHDAQRNKELHVKVSYPKADGKFPVIVFSDARRFHRAAESQRRNSRGAARIREHA